STSPPVPPLPPHAPPPPPAERGVVPIVPMVAPAAPPLTSMVPAVMPGARRCTIPPPPPPLAASSPPPSSPVPPFAVLLRPLVAALAGPALGGDVPLVGDGGARAEDAHAAGSPTPPLPCVPRTVGVDRPRVRDRAVRQHDERPAAVGAGIVTAGERAAGRAAT